MSDAISKDRTHNYLRQIKGALVYRAVAMAASFVAIPLTIGYLGKEQFGVWSTLLTVISWVVFFDLGIGNGLRNKVAESLAKHNETEAAQYIASGYTLLGMIALFMWCLVTAGSYFIPWQAVFNTQVISESTLSETVRIATFFIMLNFWIGLIAALLGAIQKTSQIAMGQLISSLLGLSLVFILSKTTDASIRNLALAYGGSLVSANILLSLWFYQNHPKLRPRVHLNKQHMHPLLAVGLQFFTIQLAVLILFTTDKILITQLFGPQYVTQYDVVYKLFSMITFAHGLISAPLWSAYTDAYHRHDFAWIRHMLRKQAWVFGGVVASVCVLVPLAKPVIGLWIGHDLEIHSQLIAVMGLLIVVSTWNNLYAMFVNGIGIIRLQLYTAVIAMIINIPLSIFFAKHTGLGVSGIVVGTVCSLLLAAVALPLQVYCIIRPTIRKQTT